MKKIIFLLTLSAILLTPSVLANKQNQGYCVRYVDSECYEYKYCNSWSSSGCNGHEICRLENNKYACFNENDTKQIITYRTKEFVDTQIRSPYKPYYNSNVVEKVRSMKMSDSMIPDPDNSRYFKPSEDNEQPPENYFKATDYGSFVNYQGPPRRDVMINYKVPYSAANRSTRQLYRHSFRILP